MQSGSDAPVVLRVDETAPETETFTLDRSHSFPSQISVQRNPAAGDAMQPGAVAASRACGEGRGLPGSGSRLHGLHERGRPAPLGPSACLARARTRRLIVARPHARARHGRFWRREWEKGLRPSRSVSFARSEGRVALCSLAAAISQPAKARQRFDQCAREAVVVDHPFGGIDRWGRWR
jgi:hypothetical protein